MKEINWQGVAIDMPFDVEVSEAHVEEDFRVLEQTGIERIIRERFIPWLKGEDISASSSFPLKAAARIPLICWKPWPCRSMYWMGRSLKSTDMMCERAGRGVNDRYTENAEAFPGGLSGLREASRYCH